MSRRLFPLVCLSSVVMLGTSCRTRSYNSAEVKHFTEIPLARQGEEVAFELRRAKDLGIPHKAYLYRRDENAVAHQDAAREIDSASKRIEVLRANTTAIDAYTNYHVRVVFPSLTQDQYEKLKRTYGGISQGWKANEPFELVDVLPPPVQAMTGLHFVTQRESVSAQEVPWMHEADPNPRTRGEINTVTNCWHAAWEAARGSASEVSVFFVGEEPMRRYLEDEAYFRVVKTLAGNEISEKSSATRNSGLEPGDLVLFYMKVKMGGIEREVLAHVATYVDDDLYFEKTNPGSDYLYRHAFHHDVARYLADEGPRNAPNYAKLRVVARRRTGTPLPRPSQVFGLDKDSGLLNLDAVAAGHKPPLPVLQSYAAVPEYSMGGGVLGTPLYRIVDVPIAPTGPHGRYQADGAYFSANGFWAVPEAAGRGEIECPAGYRKERVGSEGGVLCTDGTNAWGPFTEAMIRKCLEWTNSSNACRTERWSLNLARNARGTGRCPVGATLDESTGYCVENGNAFGPFPRALVNKCESSGGGSACASARWSLGFLRSLTR